MKKLTSSVIIPTLGRPQELKKMLLSLLEQGILPNEVIIVDQSIDNTSELMVKKMFNNSSESKSEKIVLKYIHDRNITGAAQARNRGQEEATSDIVFFFDDDVFLEPNYIEEVIKIYEKYPYIDGVGGVITNYSMNFSSKLFHKVFFRGAFADKRLSLYVGSNKYHFVELVETRMMGGGVMSVKREILNKYRFDERLWGYSFGEDIDFSFRVSERHKLVISPKAKLYHESLGDKSNVQKHSERIICFNYYFFKKNLGKNLVNYSSFVWLCVGISIEAILRLLLKSNNKPLRGLISGYEIIRNNLRNCDFINMDLRCY